MRVFASPQELAAAAGTEIGASDWITVEQDRIDQFADATGDHQWIHVDPERAAAGPFGSTIAHGFLTLSLIPHLAWQVYKVEGVRMSVNYGLDRLRFITPVKVGSKVRAVVAVDSVTEVTGGYQLAATVRIELQGSEKPAAVANVLTRFVV
ncbi:MAG TPA: MaoC family dehydratase [Actinocrinis sp.]